MQFLLSRIKFIMISLSFLLSTTGLQGIMSEQDLRTLIIPQSILLQTNGNCFADYKKAVENYSLKINNKVYAQSLADHLANYKKDHPQDYAITLSNIKFQLQALSHELTNLINQCSNKIALNDKIFRNVRLPLISMLKVGTLGMLGAFSASIGLGLDFLFKENFKESHSLKDFYPLAAIFALSGTVFACPAMISKMIALCTEGSAAIKKQIYKKHKSIIHKIISNIDNALLIS